MYFTHSHLRTKRPIRDSKFASLHPNQIRYLNACRKVCLHSNCKFHVEVAVQKSCLEVASPAEKWGHTESTESTERFAYGE